MLLCRPTRALRSRLRVPRGFHRAARAYTTQATTQATSQAEELAQAVARARAEGKAEGLAEADHQQKVIEGLIDGVGAAARRQRACRLDQHDAV